MPTGLEDYLEQLQLDLLFKRLSSSDPETLAREARYFTAKEANRRHRLVIDYFGERSVNRLVGTIYGLLLGRAVLRSSGINFYNLHAKSLTKTNYYNLYMDKRL